MGATQAPKQSAGVRRYGPIPLIVGLSLLVVGTMVWSLFTGTRIAAIHAPLADAAMEIKFEAALGHLWFEEVISGDRHEDIAVAWKHLDQSAWYARAMLEGGENSEGDFIPLHDPALRGEIEDVLAKILEFRAIAEERWATRKESGIGSEIDQRFDAVFEDFLEQADDVETSLQAAMGRGQRRFRLLQGLLIVLCLGLSALVGIVFERYERRRNLDALALRENEERYRAVAEDMPVLICRFLPGGEITYVNDAYCRYFEKTSEELVGSSFLPLIREEDRDTVMASISALTVESSSQSHEHQVIAPDGDTRWQRWTNRALFDDGGNPVAYQSIGEDITERKQTENELRKSEKKFRTIYESNLFGVMYSNMQGEILDGNDVLLGMLGYSKEDILAGRLRWDEITPPELLRRDYAAVEEIKEKGFCSPYEKEYIRKDGSRIPVIVAAALLEEGSELGIAIVVDNTEFKQAEKALRAEKEFSQQLLDNLAYGFSVVDIRGVHVDVNPALCRMTGFVREELIGIGPPHPYWPPEDFETIQQALQETVEGRFRDIELTFMRKDGERFPVLVSPSSVVDGEGNVSNYYATVKDITERKQVEKELASTVSFLDMIVDRSPFAMWVSDAEGTIIRTNSSLREALNLTDEQLLGHYNVLKDSNLETQGIARIVDDVFEKHEPARFSIPWRAAEAGDVDVEGGRDLHIDASMFPIVDFAGQLKHVVCQWVDITERVKAEQALLDSEERYRSTLDGMLEGCQIIGHDWCYLYVNDAAVQQARKTREQLLGHTMMEVSPGLESSEGFSIIRRCMEERIPHRMENESMFPDGNTGWFELLIRPVPEGIFILSLDVTERRQAERDLQRHRQQLEDLVRERTLQLDARVAEAEELNSAMVNVMEDLRVSNVKLKATGSELMASNKELDAFSRSVSHDLRAPLRHSEGFVKLLLEREKGRLDPTSLRYLETIAESSNRMGRLIDDLLAFSRTGRAEMHLQHVDSNAVVREARKGLSPMMEGRCITWEVGDLPTVAADRGLLRLVWENLISNAIKYTGLREEARIEIGEGGREGAGEIAFFVRDNGVGFDPQYTHKLFGVFQRLHRDDEFEGTGIGLATVYHIVHRHGGRVWAEGKVDHGATFHFTLKEARGEE